MLAGKWSLGQDSLHSLTTISSLANIQEPLRNTIGLREEWDHGTIVGVGSSTRSPLGRLVHTWATNSKQLGS